MKRPHVILRASGPASTANGFLDVRRSGAPAARRASRLAIEMEMLNAAGAAAAARHSEVAAVAPVMPMKLVEPLDTGLASPTASGPVWGIPAIGADTSPFTGDGVTVAVLDTGIDAAHPAFAGVTLIRRNFTSTGAGDDVSDPHGHGTHCAGTIFGRDVNGVRAGVARGIRRALIGKVLGTGAASSHIVQAIQWAVAEGAHIVSMSLGMDFPGYRRQLVEQAGLPGEAATSLALEGYRLNVLLFERLARLVLTLGDFAQPTLLIAAAGNESRTNGNPSYTIAAAPPAVSEGIISVGALGRGGNGLAPAYFSNSGALLAAPGVAIISARPGGGLVSMSGTSMAAPHAAGAAALWAQKLRALGPVNSRVLAARLLASAVTAGIAEEADQDRLGAGLVQCPQS